MTKYEYGVSQNFGSFPNKDYVTETYGDKAKAEARVRYLRAIYPDGTFNLYERESLDWNKVNL